MTAQLVSARRYGIASGASQEFICLLLLHPRTRDQWVEHDVRRLEVWWGRTTLAVVLLRTKVTLLVLGYQVLLMIGLLILAFSHASLWLFYLSAVPMWVFQMWGVVTVSRAYRQHGR